jgi:hypothetical protein
VSGLDVIYVHGPALSRIALHFLPYRPFGLTGCLHASSAVASLQYPIMALPLADASSSPPLPQGVLRFDYGQYTILVPEEFLDDSESLSNLQKRAIDVGAVYSVSCCTRVQIFTGAFRTLRGMCVQVNLPPIAREKLTFQSIGYPLCLIEVNNLVVAGVLYAFISTCAQFFMDSHWIDLSKHTPDYKAFFIR